MTGYQHDEKDSETAYDFLELAEPANTKKDVLKYAKKAVELEPVNLYALSMVIELSCISSST